MKHQNPFLVVSSWKKNNIVKMRNIVQSVKAMVLSAWTPIFGVKLAPTNFALPQFMFFILL